MHNIRVSGKRCPDFCPFLNLVPNFSLNPERVLDSFQLFPGYFGAFSNILHAIAIHFFFSSGSK